MGNLFLMRLGLLTMVALIASATGCAADPEHQLQIDALAGETPGIPKGPMHRAGQPCGLCHGPGGTNHPELSLTGTLYRTPTSRQPLPNATVRFIDATGEQRRTCTNATGNFLVQSSEWSPTFPVWAKVEIADATTPTVKLVTEMTSAIFREISCNACHSDPASPSSVGHMYFAEKESGLPAALCPCPCDSGGP